MQTSQEFPVLRKSVYALLLLIAVVFVYGNFLHNPEVFDDRPFFMFDKTLDHFRGFHPLEVRWLPYFTIAWTAQFSLKYVWFRLAGLLLHAATGIALFFFLERLFGLVLKREGTLPGGVPHEWVAFFCALFFLWHPVAVYGAAYLIQRTIVMATLFSLLALYVYMRGLTENRPRWLWGSVGLYYLAIFSKEHAVMLPAVMLVLTLLLVQPSRALVRRLLPIYAACAAIAIYVALQKLGILGSVYEVAAPEMLEKIKVENPYPLSVLTQSLLFFKYWLLWILPDPAWMSIDMREPFATAIFSPYLFAMLAFVAYGAVGLWLLLRRGYAGLLGFAMLFPWLMFATEFATVRIQESFILYRSYLWMAGAFAALPLILKCLPSRLAFYGMLFCTIALAMLSVNRLTTFANPYMLWNDAEVLVHDRQNLPGVARIYYNRGRSLVDLHRYREALADYQHALALDPEDVNNHYAVGVGFMNVNRYADAIVEFNKVLRMQPNHVQAKLGLGLSNLELGNKVAALADLKVSCEEGAKIACAKVKVLEAGKTPER
jgi:protein O-mannosyl-transferase